MTTPRRPSKARPRPTPSGASTTSVGSRPLAASAPLSLSGPDALARYYDLDVLDVSYDAELYQQLAHTAGGPVLELAVGSGRLAIPLALAGHDVLGVDLDTAMLARARSRWRRVHGPAGAGRLSLRHADMRTFRTRKRFGLTFLAINTFLLLSDDAERLAVLATMFECLGPGGVAAIEMSTPRGRELAGYDGRPRLEWLREDDETGHQVSKTVSARHDPAMSTVTLSQLFESRPPGGGPMARVSKVDTLHLVSPRRLAKLARRAGFGAVDVRGDHLPMTHGAGSHRAIVVARQV